MAVRRCEEKQFIIRPAAIEELKFDQTLTCHFGCVPSSASTVREEVTLSKSQLSVDKRTLISGSSWYNLVFYMHRDFRTGLCENMLHHEKKDGGLGRNDKGRTEFYRPSNA